MKFWAARHRAVVERPVWVVSNKELHITTAEAQCVPREAATRELARRAEARQAEVRDDAIRTASIERSRPMCALGREAIASRRPCGFGGRVEVLKGESFLFEAVGERR